MKNLKKFFATLALTLTLSGLINAGQVDAPPVVGPTPTPPPAGAPNTSTGEDTNEGSPLGATLDIILSVLSIF